MNRYPHAPKRKLTPGTAIFCLVVFIAILCFEIASAWSADLRAAYQSAQKDLAQREQTDLSSKERIYSDRSAMEAEIKRLKGGIKRLESTIASEQKRKASLKSEKTRLTNEKKTLDKSVERIVAVVRTAAKNMRDLAMASPFSALLPHRLMHLEELAEGTEFPDIQDLESLISYFHDEIRRTGEVTVQKAPITGRDGIDRDVSILTAGPFMSLEIEGNHAEPLLYDPATQTLKELPGEVSFLTGWNLKRYAKGQSDLLPLDLSSGAALDQLRRTPSFSERIAAGGPLVWPIVLIGLVGVLIGIERSFFLKRVHDNTDNTMGKVNELASYGHWDECDLIVKEKKSTPVYNVLRKGLLARGERREVLETVLQEAILKELPRLERFLPILGMLGAVAPLLGLLGTVTGMIDTFEVIHMAGTGDPKMMSGGISTALITTMMGLAVAIPIMLLHTVLNRQVEHIIGDMEEKAVALTNIVHRETLALCPRNINACPAQKRG